MKANESATAHRNRTAWMRAFRFAGAILAATAFAGLMAAPSGRGLSDDRSRAFKGRIPVTYWHMWSGEWLPVMNGVVDAFNRSQTKYVVIPLQVPYSDGNSKFLLSVAGGDPPDVMAQWDQAISTWAQAGVLSPLDSYMTPAERSSFMRGTYPVVHENGWYQGHLYGMVMGVDVYACYYRPSLFREAGLDPSKFPSSLEQLTADGTRMNAYDRAGNLTRVGFAPQGLTYFAPSFGGGFYNPRSGQVLLGTPQNLAALRYIVNSRKQIGFSKMLRFTAGLKSENGADWPFIDGSYAVALDGEWRVKQLAKYAPGLDYGLAPLPPSHGGPPLASYSVTNFLTIPAGARHPRGAWEFIKFWSGLDNPASAAAFNVAFGWLPNSPAMAASPVYRAFLRKYPKYRTFVALAGSRHLVTTPPVPYQLFLNDAIAADDDLAERGLLSPRQALARLTADVNRERRQRRELGYAQ